MTYRFYFIVEKLTKFFTFSDSMTKSYLVEFIIHKQMCFMAYRKLYKIIFPETFIFKVPFMIGYQAKFQAKEKCFLQIQFPVHAILRSVKL